MIISGMSSWKLTSGLPTTNQNQNKKQKRQKTKQRHQNQNPKMEPQQHAYRHAHKQTSMSIFLKCDSSSLYQVDKSPTKTKSYIADKWNPQFSVLYLK